VGKSSVGIKGDGHADLWSVGTGGSGGDRAGAESKPWNYHDGIKIAWKLLRLEPARSGRLTLFQLNLLLIAEIERRNPAAAAGEKSYSQMSVQEKGTAVAESWEIEVAKRKQAQSGV
jgi:hypothetical protein